MMKLDGFGLWVKGLPTKRIRDLRQFEVWCDRWVHDFPDPRRLAGGRKWGVTSATWNILECLANRRVANWKRWNRQLDGPLCPRLCSLAEALLAGCAHKGNPEVLGMYILGFKSSNTVKLNVKYVLWYLWYSDVFCCFPWPQPCIHFFLIIKLYFE